MWDQFYGEQTTSHSIAQVLAYAFLLAGIYSIAYPIRYFRGKTPWRNPDAPVCGVWGWIIEWRVPVSMACLALGLIGITNVTVTKRPFSNPHFAALPYDWTDQCPSRAYKRRDDIPAGCRQARYLIPYAIWTRYGFRHYASKWASLYQDNGIEYFRVGNDAIQITCGRNKDCWVEQMERGVFHQ